MLCRIDSDYEDIMAVQMLPFIGTNARKGFEVSFSTLAGEGNVVKSLCDKLSIPSTTEDDAEFASRCDVVEPWNVMHVCRQFGNDNMPMVSHFLSMYFPLGHIKSAKKDDAIFLQEFRDSEKWLRFEDPNELPRNPSS